ncbi:hypothetical protein AD947_01210 [Acetobacter tropicalis]|uniref:Phage protein n=1 Tax=Acetobacter tropicalis TaxID=104102 RepID=A0A149U6P9_9PROT|nr:hypothetical protein [Acetobacter tropicalis]KXV61113.1 hypothetical protein AD947_01210 [Acetobacter tropicalis]
MQIDVFNKRERACQLLRNVQSAQCLLKIKIDEFTDYIVNARLDSSDVNEKASTMIMSYSAMLEVQRIILEGLAKTPSNGKVVLSPELTGVLRAHGLIAK